MYDNIISFHLFSDKDVLDEWEKPEQSLKMFREERNGILT